MYPLLVHTMLGMGDTVYQRPWIRALIQHRQRDVFVRTAWPQLFRDMPRVHCVKPTPGLRTQDKNVEASAKLFVRGPVQAERIRVRYTLSEPGTTILDEVGAAFRLPNHVAKRLTMDLPSFGKSPVRYRKRPVAVLRPSTLRVEWTHEARAPKPEYLTLAAEELQARGYAVVLLADVDGHEEYYHGEVPPSDKQFCRGELTFDELMALIQNADVLVGGVGFVVPIGVAAKVPTVIVCGGCGGHNGPEVVTDPRMDLSRIRFIVPDNYCRCRAHRHDCDKYISDFGAKFRRALNEVVDKERAAA